MISCSQKYCDSTPTVSLSLYLSFSFSLSLGGLALTAAQYLTHWYISRSAERENEQRMQMGEIKHSTGRKMPSSLKQHLLLSAAAARQLNPCKPIRPDTFLLVLNRWRVSKHYNAFYIHFRAFSRILLIISRVFWQVCFCAGILAGLGLLWTAGSFSYSSYFVQL